MCTLKYFSEDTLMLNTITASSTPKTTFQEHRRPSGHDLLLLKPCPSWNRVDTLCSSILLLDLDQVTWQTNIKYFMCPCLHISQSLPLPCLNPSSAQDFQFKNTVPLEPCAYQQLFLVNQRKHLELKTAKPPDAALLSNSSLFALHVRIKIVLSKRS